MTDHLTVTQVAKLLGISRQRVLQLIQGGKVQGYRLGPAKDG